MSFKFFSFCFFVFLFASFSASAQSEQEFGFLPVLNLQKKLPKDWALNFKAESRQSFYKEEARYRYLLTDFSLAAAKKLSINTSVVGGYLLRVEEGKAIHRSLQQLSTVRRYPAFKLAHRLATDQTFEADAPTEYRLRYRLAMEVPLNGQALDAREFFLKFSHEYLSGLEGGEYDLEVRGLCFLGFSLTTRRKLELGFDYRLSAFLAGETRQRMWLGLNYYVSF